VADRAVLVTGATSGLGAWLVPRLAEAGLTVLVHGRDRAKVDRGVAAVREAGGTAEGYVADLASLADCRQLAAEVAARGELSILVNNAGVGFGAPGAPASCPPTGTSCAGPSTTSPRSRSRGPLLDILRANPPARVVNVGSLGQLPIDFDDLRMDHGYDGTVAYRRAKLALAAWTLDLADDLAGQG
jgi:NAD(P)-dependent dehydrogenase (short-subunit alcohol dehydrogenase family)